MYNPGLDCLGVTHFLTLHNLYLGCDLYFENHYSKMHAEDIQTKNQFSYTRNND